MNRSTLVAIPILLGLTIFQTSVLTVLPVLEQVIQPVLLSAIAWGMLRGMRDGLTWAFMGGLFLDLFSIGPWGAQSLAIMAAVAVAVWVVSTLPPRRFWVPGIIGGMCAIIYLLLMVGMIQVSRYGSHIESMPELGSFFIVQGTAAVMLYWLLFFLRQTLYPPPITGTGL